jgi:teichuronic acid biosynthesis glycosyltransferase TuaC
LPQEELAGWMRAADVFCMASRREGWPNVVNEALACGTPVVATDVGAVPEMITSEAYGAIVPPTDDEALERALETALARHWDRTEIARWGQSRGWPEVAREVIGEMGSAIAEKRQ